MSYHIVQVSSAISWQDYDFVLIAVGIPDGKIFIINPNGEVQNGTSSAMYKKSYKMILEMKDVMFPPLSSESQRALGPTTVPEDYNASNYWGDSYSAYDLNEEDLL